MRALAGDRGRHWMGNIFGQRFGGHCAAEGRKVVSPTARDAYPVTLKCIFHDFSGFFRAHLVPKPEWHGTNVTAARRQCSGGNISSFFFGTFVFRETMGAIWSRYDVRQAGRKSETWSSF